MTDSKEKKAAPTASVSAPEVKPVAPAAPAKKAPAPVAKVAKPAAKPAATPKVTPATAKARPARKPTAVDAAVAKHQQALAEALEKAEAIQYDKPPATKPGKSGKAKSEKADKVPKPRKTKLVRDSYAMPEAEYARIAELKKRMSSLGSEVKKSELLRGGIALLSALNDAELKAVMGRVERIKTGRPSKK